MSSRSARRNAHKRLAHSLKGATRHSALACRWLTHWRREADRRARLLGAPAAWRLLREPSICALLQRLDETGELAADLARVIAEAIAAASDPRLVPRGGRRPEG